MRAKTVKFCLIVLFVLAIMMLEVSSGESFAQLLHDAKTAFNTTNLIRLHIMANSDSPDDQALKMVIRDTVLREVRGLLIEATTKPEVWQVLSESISRIENAARDELDKEGKCYDVTVELGTFSFPPCTYGDFQVPQGDYDAIRVILGRGAGQNWWCVLFPPLCFIEIADGGRIQGLDSNISPDEALLRLNMNFKASLNEPWIHDFLIAIPILEMSGLSAYLPLSLKDLL